MSAGDPFEGWSRDLLIETLVGAEDAAFRQTVITLKLVKELDRLAGLLDAAKGKRTAPANRARRLAADALAEQARAMRASGKSVALIAKAIDRTEQRVYQLIRRPNDVETLPSEDDAPST